MMPNHEGFSYLQFPQEWGTPKFQMGETVIADGDVGLVVGYTYHPPTNFHSVMNNAQPGLWVYVLFPPRILECPVGNVLGYHQDVIQPVLAPAVDEVQHQHSGMAPINSFYIPLPLA